MSAEPSILFVKPKSVKQADKTALRKAGVTVVEVDDPGSVKFVRPGVELSSTALLQAAVAAIAESKDGHTNYPQSAFARAVCAAIKDIGK